MMQTAAFYENHGGVAHFSVSHLPQATLLPWWVGSQPVHGEPFGQLKSPTEGDPRLEASLAMQHKSRSFPYSRTWPVVSREMASLTTGVQQLMAAVSSNSSKGGNDVLDLSNAESSP
ncbi:hypothetical protein B296_00007951, partial [Ensete ventricosum]